MQNRIPFDPMNDIFRSVSAPVIQLPGSIQRRIYRSHVSLIECSALLGNFLE